MRRPHGQALPTAPAHSKPLEEDLKRLAWPILKRLPAYAKLAWALGKEPTIPRRHKTLLYSAVLFTVTPVQFLTAPIPVLGQIDGVVLFLLGIRQALGHCPPEVAARHLTRLRLSRNQLERDLRVSLYIAWRAVGKVGNPVGRNLRFAGRVAGGFGRRLARRLASAPAQKQITE
jgi:uncharacterized membrane protein YkvA (DUF1232 family)